MKGCFRSETGRDRKRDGRHQGRCREETEYEVLCRVQSGGVLLKTPGKSDSVRGKNSKKGYPYWY